MYIVQDLYGIKRHEFQADLRVFKLGRCDMVLKMD